MRTEYLESEHIKESYLAYLNHWPEFYDVNSIRVYKREVTPWEPA